MLPRRNTLLILAIFIIALTAIRLAFLSYLQPAEHPKAVSGVLDLRGWSMPENRTITLNGEWAFYPSAFIQPNSSLLNADPGYIQVPGSWEHAFPEDSDASYRYGTYRLRILADEQDDVAYKLRINRINDASAVYVNGELAEMNGNPSETRDGYKARVLPYFVTIPSAGSRIDLVIHISSHAGKGGIVDSIRLGSEEAVDHLNLLSWGLQLGLCIVFLIHGLYATMLFFFRVANQGLLYFALIMFLGIMIVLAADDKLLFVWMETPYELYKKIAVWSYIAVVACIPPLFRHMFDTGRRTKLLWWSTCFSAAYALFVLIAPARYIDAYMFLLGINYLVVIIVSSIILSRALRRSEDVIFVLLGLTAVGNNIIWTSVLMRLPVDKIHYPFDLAFAVFAFAAFWFKRFFRTVNQTKLLAEKLQLANQQKDDFLVSTSHELRNPLHGIMNITQSMLDDSVHPVPDEHRKRLKIQAAVARRMSLMLDDLIDITRLKENTIRLRLRSLPIEPLVNGTIDILRYMLDGKPIAIHIHIADNFPDVHADENRLAQILFNLIHNAIKFTDAGTISIQAEVVNGLPHIRIKDTGIGMDEETRSRIFMPYEQGDSERIKASGGFGLGLSITKQLVELHGGSLSAVSSPGNGSEFTFTLPVGQNSELLKEPERSQAHIEATAPVQSAAASSAPSPSRNRAKILVIDDDSVNLNILVDVLGSVHYDVITASNAAEALAKLETAAVDLVISDVMMPHVSGYELTRLIRKRFSLSELPILLLTARNRPEDLLAGFQAGANDYVTKPVDAWELKSRVRASVDLKLSFEERLRMEAAWLQAQIKPHFLYNTINSIAALGTMDLDKMQRLLGEFSNYLRTSFDFHNSDQLVSIDRELDLVRSYLYIEQERFGERLEIQWVLADNLRFQLPPLSIQTLVENAVNHGILPRTRGGRIHIQIAEAEDHVEIRITDNGVGMNQAQIQQVLDGSPSIGSGIGLRNTDRRLKQLYGKGLRMHSVPEQGTTVTFQLPKEGVKIRNER
ncbi:ATP-binding protein [Paenibacillus nanensis]|uniref:ATP-binding protein n=1 Tax=Paenibacillus nanensis TaxID=393251 RepID=UPI001F0B8330|nr:ATP-binding protein [Paenibacillus nanensis]